MNSLFNNYVSNLENSYKQNNKSNIQRITNELILVQQQPDFPQMIHRILKNASISNQTKLAAAVQFSQCIVNSISNRDIQQQFELCKQGVNILGFQIEQNIKKQILVGLDNILFQWQGTKYFEMVIKQLLGYINNLLGNTAMQSYIAYEKFLNLGIIILDNLRPKQLEKFFNQTFQNSITITLNLIVYFQNILIRNPLQIQYYHMLNLIRLSTKFIKLFCRKLCIEIVPELVIFFYNNVTLLKIIIQKSLNIGIQSNHNKSIISLSTVKEASMLNQIKANIIVCIQRCLQIQNKLKSDGLILPQVLQLGRLLELIIDSVAYTLMMKNVEEIQKNTIVKKILRLMKTSLKSNNFQNLYLNKANVIFNLLMSILNVVALDQFNYQIYFQRFTRLNQINNSIAMIQKQDQNQDTIGIIQIEAAYFMIEYCRYAHGILKSIYYMTINAIVENNEANNEINSNLLMIILLNSMKSRSDLIQNLKTYAKQWMLHYLKNIQVNLLTKQKIFRFLKFMIIYGLIDHIPSSDTQTLQLIVQFSFNFINNKIICKNDSPLINLCILMHRKIMDRNLQLDLDVVKYIQILIQWIENEISYHALRILNDLLTKNKKIFSEQQHVVLRLVIMIAQKIYRYYQNNSTKDDKQKNFHYGCFKLLVMVIEQNLNIYLANELESIISNIYDALCLHLQVVEEYIIQIMQIFQLKYKIISQNQIKQLPHFIQIISKKKFIVPYNIFQILITFFEFRSLNPQQFNIWITFLIKCINVKSYDSINQYDKCPSFLLLLQILKNFNANNNINRIIQLSNFLYKQLKNQNEDGNNLIVSYSVAILAFLVTTYMNIFSNSQKEQYIQIILFQLGVFQDIYASRIYILSLIKLMTSNNQIVNERYFQFFDCIITLLKYLELNQMDKQILQYKESTQSSTQKSSRNHYIDCAKYLFSEFIKQNQTNVFIQLCHHLKYTNSRFYQLLINNLSQEKIQFLKNHTHQKVLIGNSTRKIYKIKA